ncbi:MAG: right-handed parallel beta-helix repeat-containing protein [Deltaproteobacteria bacterium]|nr:right-handed parallel beta-helix repeat-containing protein [Deltaproteobacteria bacterium]
MKTLLAALLPLLLLSPPSFAGAPTILSGNTVWRGAVEVSGETVVAAGATLLVLPGAKIRFAGAGADGALGARLVVHGALVAQGTAEEPILFTSSSAAPHAGDWGGVSFDGSDGRVSRLSHCQVEYASTAVTGREAAVALEECSLTRSGIGFASVQGMTGEVITCEVRDNDVGLVFDQSAGVTVEGCRIEGNARAGISCTNRSSPRIADCLIAGNGKDGVACVQGSSPRIEYSEISGHERGVYAEGASRPTLVRNTIRGNATGIWAEGLAAPTVDGNAVSGNRVGIYCAGAAYPQILGNDLSGNETFGLVAGDPPSTGIGALPGSPEQGQPPSGPGAGLGPGRIDARGNWWGAEVVAQMKAVGPEGNVRVIEDARDKPEAGYTVVFAPWQETPPPPAGRRNEASSGVKGKVFLDGKPVAGARVHAYGDARANFMGEGVAYSSPTGADGVFSLRLPPGRYFLVGKRSGAPFPGEEPGAGELFGFFGGNPVTVSPATLTGAYVQLVRRIPPKVLAGNGRSAVLEGVAVGPDGPQPDVWLSLYADAATDFHGPALSGADGSVPGGTGADGTFSVEVPLGTYYVLATRRQDGGRMGPLLAGDRYAYFDGNPVAVAPGQRVAVTLQLVEKLRENDAGRSGSSGAAGIRGVLRDPEGKPVSGVFAFATTDPNVIGRMPPFRSQRSGADGAYFIDLPAGGTYYVGARSGYGGPPRPGEWQGMYGDRQPVTVDVGRVVEGIDITVRPAQ